MEQHTSIPKYHAIDFHHLYARAANYSLGFFINREGLAIFTLN